MGLDVVAVSRVQLETPDLHRLTELGLTSTEFITKIEQSEIDRGFWLRTEPGSYWSGPGSYKLHQRIGSYTYYAQWRDACWEIEPGTGLAQLLMHSDCDGGFGAEEAAELYQELSERRLEAEKIWHSGSRPFTRDLVHRKAVKGWLDTWDQFTELSKIAADDGLILLC